MAKRIDSMDLLSEHISCQEDKACESEAACMCVLMHVWEQGEIMSDV